MYQTNYATGGVMPQMILDTPPCAVQDVRFRDGGADLVVPPFTEPVMHSHHGGSSARHLFSNKYTSTKGIGMIGLDLALLAGMVQNIIITSDDECCENDGIRIAALVLSSVNIGLLVVGGFISGILLASSGGDVVHGEPEHFSTSWLDRIRNPGTRGHQWVNMAATILAWLSTIVTVVISVLLSAENLGDGEN